jgi:alkyl sulfatase BDS1-like metallo-beta-lactamase superfamily hydrolase
VRWALWLAQTLVASQPGNKAGRAKKAELLDRLAVDCANPLMKNWMHSDAELLRGNATLPAKPKINGATIAEMPVEQILRMIPSRLHPERAAAFTARIGFDFPDTGKQYTFIVRRGIGEMAPGMNEPCDVVIRATEIDFRRYFIAADSKPTSAEFRKHVKFVAPAGGVFSQLGVLRLLLRLRRSLIQP